MISPGAGVLDQITSRSGNRLGVCNAFSFFPGCNVAIYSDLSKGPKANATIVAIRRKRNEIVVNAEAAKVASRGDYLVLRSAYGN